MKGETYHIKEEYLQTSRQILEIIGVDFGINQDKKVIVIAGESGSGKSVTAVCLQKLLEEQHITCFILHQDDYFKLPPRSNHLERLRNTAHIGSSEVNLPLLQTHVESFLNNTESFTKPVVCYQEDLIIEETYQIKNIQVLIVEGTYTFAIKGNFTRIFMDLTYEETRQQRIDRGRDEVDGFIESVLKIEHQLIRPQKEKADIVVLKDYSAIRQ